MAQAAFNNLKKLYPQIDAEYEAVSWGAGIKENGTVNPKVIEPMKQIGMDLTNTDTYFSKDINHPFIQEKLKDIVKVLSICGEDKTCVLPEEMNVKTEDITGWDIEDPTEENSDVISIRDKIIGKTIALISDLNKNI